MGSGCAGAGVEVGEGTGGCTVCAGRWRCWGDRGLEVQEWLGCWWAKEKGCSAGGVWRGGGVAYRTILREVGVAWAEDVLR